MAETMAFLSAVQLGSQKEPPKAVLSAICLVAEKEFCLADEMDNGLVDLRGHQAGHNWVEVKVVVREL